MTNRSKRADWFLAQRLSARILREYLEKSGELDDVKNLIETFTFYCTNFSLDPVVFFIANQLFHEKEIANSELCA